MEEPGEDPPGLDDDTSDIEEPDDIATSEHYDGDIAAADDTSDQSPADPTGNSDTSDAESVFDDDDSVAFDFLQPESDSDSDSDSDQPPDDNLRDFLGQFGD